LFWYLQREFLSLMREFSGGKLKQKGFFHSAAPGYGPVRQTYAGVNFILQSGTMNLAIGLTRS